MFQYLNFSCLGKRKFEKNTYLEIFTVSFNNERSPHCSTNFSLVSFWYWCVNSVKMYSPEFKLILQIKNYHERLFFFYYPHSIKKAIFLNKLEMLPIYKDVNSPYPSLKRVVSILSSSTKNVEWVITASFICICFIGTTKV